MTAALVSWRTALVMTAGATATAATAAFLCCCPVCRRTDPGVIDRATRRWARAWLRTAGARVTVRGAENINPRVAYTVVCNHQSNLDSMALLQALPLSVRFLAKAEMFRTPLLGAGMRAAGMVEVNRAAPDLRQISDGAARCLKDGHSLLVYPEGTTSAEGTIRAFKDGAFVLAIDNQVPVLPVAIEGTDHVWPPGRAAVHPGRVRIVIGRPVLVDGLVRRDTGELRDRARDAVVAAHRDLTAGGAPS